MTTRLLCPDGAGHPVPPRPPDLLAPADGVPQVGLTHTSCPSVEAG